MVTGGGFDRCTAGINRSKTAVRAVLEQPCLTGGRTGTVQPKQEPTGWTDLSNRSRLVLCDRSQELIGQACPIRRQVLWSESACPTTGAPLELPCSTGYTAGINRSNTAVRAVLKQPCLTAGRTGTVRPKHLPPGRTGLSNQFLGPVAQDQPGPVGQICPTSWLLLWSDSARPTTGRTWLFEHRSNCRVRPVNAGSDDNDDEHK
ncbi:hypothetical protein PCANC_27520 [Puccinia coronata f. sp. avenae]|uniref:Uncharacterized protein n=1 Tax=Puccinia coronata f. sp. avenae TaxID=200324 RepID=A0A2N5S708_9BASI|nr:hypothetical protein PCANC_27520 [Puccinia coronata f. sp. avenae]